MICVGGWPTSKVLREWLQRADPETVMLTDRVDNLDGLRLRTRHVRGGFDAWCAGYRGQVPLRPYARRWLAEEKRVAQSLGAVLGRGPGLVEPAVVPVLARHLPARTTLFVASSMPVRDAEYFWPANDRGHVLCFNEIWLRG